MLHRPVRFPFVLPLLALLLLLAVPVSADEVPDGADLEDLLAAYDRRGGGNTIPIERAILALREAGAVDDLADHLGHPRFGATVAWALATNADEALARRIVAAVGRWNAREQGMAASTLARLPDGAGLPILQEMGARESLPGWARPLVSGALLAAGDPDTVGAVKKELRAKEPEAVATALKAVAHSHDPAWLPALSALRRDERALPQKVRSHFQVRSTKEGPTGRSTWR
jgi:pimeloyl-ACP methyl ester carboxylesterase